jgi:hypothetical protein
MTIFESSCDGATPLARKVEVIQKLHAELTVLFRFRQRIVNALQILLVIKNTVALRAS